MKLDRTTLPATPPRTRPSSPTDHDSTIVEPVIPHGPQLKPPAGRERPSLSPPRMELKRKLDGPGNIPMRPAKKPMLKLQLPKEAPKPTAAFRLPPDLAGRAIKFSSEVLGNGSNGIVTGITVDGVESEAHVAKTVLVENYRGGNAALEKLVQEIKINDEMAVLQAQGKLPANIVTASGVMEVEGQLAMLMPKIHGGTLAQRVSTLYHDVIDGRMPPKQFVDHFRPLLRGPMQGLVKLHEHGIVMNDLNLGNLMFDKPGDRGMVIDFGLAGHEGEHRRPGTIGTLPPERLQFSDEALAQEAGASTLSPSADAYAFGAVLYAFVHGDYPAWCTFPEGADNDAKMFEMGLTVKEFRERGSIFPDAAPPLDANLRAGGKSERELALRSELRQQGFYEMIGKLMHPDPKERSSLRQALEGNFFGASNAR